MKKIGFLLLTASVVLSACGTRSEDGETGGQAQFSANGEQIDGTPTVGAALPEALNVRVLSDNSIIETGGTDVAKITALVTNELNQAVADAEVEFSSTGGVLQQIDERTNEIGEATASLVLAQDFQNQTIQVDVSTASSTDQSFSGSVVVQASGSVLEIEGPRSLILGNEGELAITLKAGNGEPVANREITVASTAGNTVTPASAFTNPDGLIQVTVGSANGDDTISVSALDGSVVESHTFTVNQDTLSFNVTGDVHEYDVGAVNDLTVTWLKQGVPVVGQPLRFSITAGQLLSSSIVTTDAAGRAPLTFSSTSAGPATITVEAGDTGEPANELRVEFVATTPSAVSLQSSDTRVQARDTSEITAIVVDANANPVKNQEVVFSSPDLRGGQLSPASATTNTRGEASVTFTAGGLATEADAVQIFATVESTGTSNSTALTVTERLLNVTLGTSNLLQDRGSNTQYAIAYVVQVADGGGNPLPNATVEVSIRPLSYIKGEYRLVDRSGTLNTGEDDWTADRWARFGLTCDTEDQNGNRILDLDEGEDINNNAQLDPQDPAVLSPIVSTEELPTLVGGSVTTDATGSGYFELLYPKSNAEWAMIEITAYAQDQGVESEASYRTGMPVLADDLRLVNVNPPNRYSPYGTVLDCTVTD